MTTTTVDLTRALLARGPIDFIDRREARQRWAAFRAMDGAAHNASPLLTAPADNTKFNKTSVATYGLALAQASMSGFNVCRFSTPDCRAGCVATAGRAARMPHIHEGRARKTRFLAADPEAFITLLFEEVRKIWGRHGVQCRVRLNTFSDIPWERVCPEIFERFPLVRFYDYTKHPIALRGVQPAENYRLTFSASERTSEANIRAMINTGVNVAVVFSIARSKPLPPTYRGMSIVDGDASDDRWSDPSGVIVGLRAKGRMIHQDGGMSRSVA